MSDESSHWRPVLFKGRKVYAEAESDGRLLERSGRVSIVYRLGAQKSYRTFVDRLKIGKDAVVQGPAVPPPVPSGSSSSSNSSGVKPAAKKVSSEGKRGSARKDSEVFGGQKADLTRADAIHIWTDGACSGNPGPAGSGTILLFPGERLELGYFLGDATNNIAELTAILVGLKQIDREDDRPIVVHTDSQYSIGVLARGWKAKSNVALIQRIRKLVESHPRIVWHWVRGHEGVALNEAADRLAREAVAARGDIRRESQTE